MTALVGQDGRVRLGIFDEPVTRINVEDFDLLDVMGKKAGRLQQHFGFNQFQYFGIISETLIAGCAIADTRYLGVGFAYVYDVASKTVCHRQIKRPMAHGFEMSLQPDEGTSRCRLPKGRYAFVNSSSPLTKAIDIDLPGLQIQAHFDETAAGFEPMSICTRAGVNGFVFARKVAGVPARGTISSDIGLWNLEDIRAGAHYDYSAGFMRRDTFWNWACLSGEDSAGRMIGLNLSCGVNETSFTENCFWIDGRLHKVDLVYFDYDQRDMQKPWHITSWDGQVDLWFAPEGSHSEKIYALLLASNFHQIYGRFSGTLKLPNGDSINIDQNGFVEHHFARW